MKLSADGDLLLLAVQATLDVMGGKWKLRYRWWITAGSLNIY